LEALHPELERLHGQLGGVLQGVDRLERYAADSAISMRRVLKAVTSEVPERDCPRLFTLAIVAASWRQKIRFYEQRYRLVLWCEHPGQWHPWPPARYELPSSKEWLRSLAPYATLLFKALRLVVPVAAAAVGVMLSEDQLKNAERELELMKVIVEKTPGVVVDQNDGLPDTVSDGRLTRAEGSALRALRVLLLQIDRPRAFGGMRFVQAPSGEALWVCTDHYREYDPGLPTLHDHGA
jgi:hypothetical protein